MLLRTKGFIALILAASVGIAGGAMYKHASSKKVEHVPDPFVEEPIDKTLDQQYDDAIETIQRRHAEIQADIIAEGESEVTKQ